MQKQRRLSRKKEIKGITITEEAQKELFEVVYAEYEKNAKRICTKSDVTKVYGVCKWKQYPAELTELVTDLLYRGDYTPATRKYLQPAILSEDPEKIKRALKRIPKVPADRAKRREELIKRWKKRKDKSSNLFLSPPINQQLDHWKWSWA